MKGEHCYTDALSISTEGLAESLHWASQGALVVKNPPANAEDRRDLDSIPGSGRSPGGRHGSPLQYSCLKTLMDRGAWRAVAGRVAN